MLFWGEIWEGLDRLLTGGVGWGRQVKMESCICTDEVLLGES